MKCVCPMGGTRECPNDCPLAVWANLSVTDRKAQRRTLAERLHKQGLTQQQIATQLGVDQKTISRDLEQLGVVPNGQLPNVHGRPRGGRPKGSGTTPAPHTTTAGQSAATRAVRNKIRPAIEAGEPITVAAVGADTGHSRIITEAAIAAERGRLEGLQEAADNDLIANGPQLSKTATDRLEAMQRRIDKQTAAAQKRFEQEKQTWARERDFHVRAAVQAEVQDWLQNIIHPMYNEKIGDAYREIRARRYPFTQAEYRKLMFALHPDQTSEANRAIAFNLLREREASLRGVDIDKPPSMTVAELMAAREAKRKQNSERARAAHAKRNAMTPQPTRH